MSRVFPCSVACLALGWAGSLLHADAPAPKASEGCRIVPLKQGGRTTYIQVKEPGDPFKNVKNSGGSSPDHFSFNQTNPMANKTYDTGSTASSHDQGTYQKNLEHTFLTKSYFTDHANDKMALPSHFPVGSAHVYSDREFDKGFLTARADVGQNKTAEGAAMTSQEQGRTAMLGGHEVEKPASSMSGKTFEGPEARAAKRDLRQMNEGLLGIKDLPDRPLTIDEVRALINHGVKPQTDEKPPEPTKALNDPDYTPDPAPAPMRASSIGNDHLRDDNDIIPPPGMMGHVPPPENSEPLPK